ncbi:MAG: VWA domain-containing protein [Anaerolineae bacterium]
MFTLRFDGTVAAWAPDGRPVASWAVAPVGGERFSLPADIAAAPGGRVYVLDGESRAILVYEPRPGTAPTPTATPDPPCTVTGDKTASPAQVVLGRPVTIDLTVDIRCRGGAAPESEIMLIIDRSNSMAGVKLAAAKAAADSFVASPSLDFTANRVGLVSFSDLISLDQPLTHDRAAVRAAVGDIQHTGNTDLATALRRATEHVLAEGRPGARPVLLMMTDGKPSRLGQPYVDTVVEAARAKAHGALVYTIGLGDTIETDLLVTVAGAPSRYFAAPRPDQLATIYAELSQTVGGVVATDVLVVDGLGPDMAYVPGSATRGGTLAGSEVSWSLGALPSGKATLSLQVTPGRLGRLPTNTRATAGYTAAGQRFTFEFPVPEVEVVPAPTATPTPTPRPTPRVTGPSEVYLPIVQRNHCQADDARLGAEIVLVIDTSSSMAGAPLDAAKAAARTFVDLLDRRRDRSALVTFDETPRLAQALTGNPTLVKNAIDAMTTAAGTRVDLGLAKGADELRLRARTGSQRVLVFMSDGQPTEGTRDAALKTAADVRRTGAIIFAIGLGDADGTFLAAIVTTARNYYHAPSRPTSNRSTAGWRRSCRAAEAGGGRARRRRAGRAARGVGRAAAWPPGGTTARRPAGRVPLQRRVAGGGRRARRRRRAVRRRRRGGRRADRRAAVRVRGAAVHRRRPPARRAGACRAMGRGRRSCRSRSSPAPAGRCSRRAPIGSWPTTRPGASSGTARPATAIRTSDRPRAAWPRPATGCTASTWRTRGCSATTPRPACCGSGSARPARAPAAIWRRSTRPCCPTAGASSPITATAAWRCRTPTATRWRAGRCPIARSPSPAPPTTSS